MKAAIECVNNGEMNVTDAAKLYQIPRQTLDDWVKRKYDKDGSGPKTELTAEEEDVLVKYCLYMAKCNHPLSVNHIKAFAWAMSKKDGRKSKFSSTSGPSWKWWRGKLAAVFSKLFFFSENKQILPNRFPKMSA